jgi:hypothetical protein
MLKRQRDAMHLAVLTSSRMAQAHAPQGLSH